MSHSEDSTTPAAPFSGDESVFDQPDVLLSSPVTTERVVDTQSGFLLVVRRMGERLALTCKRRIGTPPNSVIMLTPDESVKLSKVLAASLSGMPDSAQRSSARLNVSGRRRLPFAAPVVHGSEIFQKLKKPAVVLLALCLFASAFMIGLSVHKDSPPKIILQPGVDPLAPSNVERFARTFVGEMLDFSTETYRISQVRAMSVMAPELMQKYWKETSFPVAPDQLKLLPQSTMVVIDKIDQQRLASDKVVANVFAQLVRSDKKLSSAVHIKLKLQLTEAGTISVIGQDDLTTDNR